MDKSAHCNSLWCTAMFHWLPKDMRGSWWLVERCRYWSPKIGRLIVFPAQIFHQNLFPGKKCKLLIYFLCYVTKQIILCLLTVLTMLLERMFAMCILASGGSTTVSKMTDSGGVSVRISKKNGRSRASGKKQWDGLLPETKWKEESRSSRNNERYRISGNKSKLISQN